MKFSVGILTGGKSSRMGTDKSQLYFRGKKLVDQLIELTRNYSDDILVAGPDLNSDSAVGFVQDQELDKGPLSGIQTALTHAKNDWVMILACDMPLYDEQIMNWLIEQLDTIQEEQIAYVKSERDHYLIGFYHKSLLNDVSNILTSDDLRVRQLLKANKFVVWELPNDLQASVSNVNSPSDLNTFGWMKVKILAFGQVKETLGESELHWITEGNNSLELLEELYSHFPRLKEITFRMAVNETIVDDQVLNMNDTIALLPPFAGG